MSKTGGGRGYLSTSLSEKQNLRPTRERKSRSDEDILQADIHRFELLSGKDRHLGKALVVEERPLRAA